MVQKDDQSHLVEDMVERKGYDDSIIESDDHKGRRVEL